MFDGYHRDRLTFNSNQVTRATSNITILRFWKSSQHSKLGKSIKNQQSSVCTINKVFRIIVCWKQKMCIHVYKSLYFLQTIIKKFCRFFIFPCKESMKNLDSLKV